MNRRARAALRAAVLVALLVPMRARAEETSHERVLVVAENPSAPLVSKLRVELGTGGYEVEVLSAAATRDLSAEAAVRHARAVLRVAPTSDSVDLWIADREGVELRFRDRISASDGNDDLNVMAIRAHEAVHGKLLPTITMEPSHRAMSLEPPSPWHGDVPELTTPPPIAPPSLPEPTLAASLGPSALASPGGGLGITGGAALGFAWLATSRLSVDALVRIPILATTVNATEGTARVNVATLGAGASIAFADPSAVVRPSIGAGLALAWTHVDGEAAASFISHSDDLFAAMPYVRASASLRLTSKLRLRVDFVGAITLPTEAITFSGQRIATFGAPILDGSLALEVFW